jgi:hypothetical protein
MMILRLKDAALCFGLFVGFLGVTQMPRAQSVSFPPTSVTIVPPQSPAAAEMAKNGAEANRVALHKKAIADADRLVLLAGQLKSEMDKSTPDMLSVEVIKKAAEIERLAREVKKAAKS